MALVLRDRCRETTTTTGTGTYTLAGAVAGFESFNEVGDGNTTYYCCTDDTDFEIGIGTYTASGTTLARTTILQSSNSDNAVDWGSGTKNIFVTLPADKIAFEDDSNDVTIGGTLIVNGDPTANLEVATKQYVDNLTAASIHVHEAVRVEKEGNLSATYDNGTNGVGATLTNNSTQEALVIDGVTMVANDRVLVYEQTDATQNGVYTVTNVGSGSTNWVLTRATDADSHGNSDATTLDEGSYFYVEEGNAGAGEAYTCTVSGTITFGTTNITFGQFAATPTFSAGTNIDITNRTISVTGKVANADQLDGVDSTGYLRSDAADTKTSGDLSFSDNVKAKFGTGNDLEVYHDGSNSYVREAGTGDLILMGDSVSIRNAAFDYAVKYTTNAEVSLYYDNVKKLETASGGVVIDGDTQTDTLTIDNGSNDWKFRVVSNALIISYGGTDKAKLDSSGNLTVVGDVTAFGTI
jgi:hypothetical protein